MKHSFKFALCALAVCTATLANADDADQVLDRQKTLTSMQYKRDQLKVQADMAKSYKEMSDAGFIVDSEGNPLGVENIQSLGIEVRKQGRANEGNPFQTAGSPVVPNAMPFMLDQPTLSGSVPSGATSPFAQQQRAPMPAPAGPLKPEPQKQPASEDDDKKILALQQVRGDSVIIRTNDGDRVLRVGEKVYDLTLTRFDVDRAWLKGPKGTQVVAIDWTKSKRYADD